MGASGHAMLVAWLLPLSFILLAFVVNLCTIASASSSAFVCPKHVEQGLRGGGHVLKLIHTHPQLSRGVGVLVHRAKGREVDRDEHKAAKKLLKLETKQNRKREARAPPNLVAKRDATKPRSSPGKQFAQKTILGQNIMVARGFSLEAKKTYTFMGGFEANLPITSYPEFAFIGRSNVGKSSLLNTLVGANSKLARVSATPGRTQMINLFECADNDGPLLIFADLPGYGFAKVGKDDKERIAAFLETYFLERGPLRMVFVLVDPRREPLEADYNLINFLQVNEVPFVVVATKTDKITPSELQVSLETLRATYGLPEGYPIPFSSVNGAGRKAVWTHIRDVCAGKPFVKAPAESSAQRKLDRPKQTRGTTALEEYELMDIGDDVDEHDSSEDEDGYYNENVHGGTGDKRSEIGIQDDDDDDEGGKSLGKAPWLR